MYYVYMLRCIDNSVYTGITTNLERRMEEHFSKSQKCAKYTFRHTAKKLEVAWQTTDRTSATKLEYHIKTLTKLQKENLISNIADLQQYLSDKIDISLYTRVNFSPQ